MLKRIFREQSGLLTYAKDDNGYYVVYLNGNLMVVTLKEEHAKKVIENITPLYNWKKVKDIESLFIKDRKSYEKVAIHLRKYGVEQKYNGNYLESLEDGLVSYKLSNQRSVVLGENYTNGIAIRSESNAVAVDSVYTGKTLAKFSTKGNVGGKVDEFVAEISKHFVVTNGEMMNRLLESNEIVKYIKELEVSLENGLGTISPPEEDMLRIQFKLYGSGDPDKEKVFIESFKKLNKMVGLKAVKEQMEAFTKTVAVDKKLKELNRSSGEKSPMHAVFTGNAGTGKTVVARLFADLLWSIDMIDKRKLVETSKEKLVGMYVGETEVNTSDAISSAMGGVLFVDEAYMLADNEGSDNNGKTSLEIIMRAMENHRDSLVVIFAGYEKEIKELLDMNQGLRSRFAHEFLFEDFNEEELAKVAITMIEQKGFNPVDLDEAILKVIKKNTKKGKLQGNARSVRKIVDRIVEKHKISISNGIGHYKNINANIVLSLIESGEGDEKRKESKKKSEEKLNNLIGLKELKSEIKNWSNYITIEKKRFDKGLSTEKPTFHMTFEGNPGTGKTTVARIIGEILKYNGLLSKGHFTEVSRGDLIGEYMGHTAVRVKDVIQDSLGGILFIDEAYSLVQSKDDAFGKEAVDTLIAEMENNRDDLVVILAGYTKEIDGLLESNPGFKSRVANRFEFPEYAADELYELFLMNMNSYGFNMEEVTKEYVKKYIENKKEINKVDGNGRWVRNLVDKIKMNQANRLVEEDSDDLQEIVLNDVKNLL